MKCPKCEEGTLSRVYFKKRNEEGIQCDFCGTVWLEDESVRANTGHPIQALTHDEDMEYTLVDDDERSEQTKSIQYPQYK